jgi:GT2 family glycosyltransferase
MGVRRAAEAMLWRLGTAASKLYIRLQDKLGWYTYTDWIRENEANSAQVRNEAELTFSFLLPISVESFPFLADTLNSLLNQTTPGWEAWLLYDRRYAPEIDAALSGFSAHQAQIITVEIEPASRLDNTFPATLEMAHGDWVGMLWCGDTLSRDALSRYTEHIRRQPQAEIIYPDEDLLAADGQSRRSPFFKPDWSPELLLSINYLANAIFRREAIGAATVGGGDFEDTIYRCAKEANCIVHVPMVLYHRHETGQDVCIGLAPQPATLKAHLERCGLDEVRIHNAQNGMYHVTWAFHKTPVSIIIPTRDRVNYLKRCVQSILERTQYPDFEILLVENNSREQETLDYYESLRAVPEVRIVKWQGAFNYSKANNYGASQARGDLLLFLNNDVEVIDPGWLEEMARWASRPEIGVVGAKLLYPNGTIQHAGIILGMEGHASHVFGGIKECQGPPYGYPDWYRNYLAVTGACMMMRKDVFLKTGGFDESYTLVFSDIEICLRATRLGYRVVYDPFVQLIHYEGRTRARFIPASDIRLGYEHFAEIVARGDPYYNPNLSLATTVPTMKRRNEPFPIRRLENIVNYS